MGGGGKIMGGRRWSWVVGKLWLVVDGSGWSHNLVMHVFQCFLLDDLTNTV